MSQDEQMRQQRVRQARQSIEDNPDLHAKEKRMLLGQLDEAAILARRLIPKSPRDVLPEEAYTAINQAKEWARQRGLKVFSMKHPVTGEGMLFRCDGTSFVPCVYKPIPPGTDPTIAQEYPGPNDGADEPIIAPRKEEPK